MVVNITRDGDIAVVTVDNPPVNALGQALRQGLWDAVATLDAAADVRAVVLICAGRTFIAGADVTEFGKPPVPPHLPDLVDRIEGAAKPWVAAIHGSALGGGLEVAMGCRFRVALETAALGLPEVGLGIVPGASGTVRTPRLVGAAAAVELVTTGRPVKAERARAMGLVDAVVTGDLRTAAVAFARTALEAPLPLPVSARPVTAPDAAWWEDQHAAIAARAKGELAPLRALDCLRVAAERPFAEALAHERATFLALRGSDQAAALRHIFFAERAAPRPSHVTAAPRPLRSAAVIGGGVRGAGLASALRSAGLSVVLVADDDAAVLRGPQTGGPSTKAMAERIGDADLVIVAAEGALAMPAVLGRLGGMCRADAVLAVPTGAGDPHRTAEPVPTPARVLGLNLFGPTAGVALLEIVPTAATAPETLATGFALARALGRILVQTGLGGGSIGHRLLRRTRAAAEDLIRQGLAPATVDAAMRAYGFALGPFEAWDGGDPVNVAAMPGQGTPGRADLSDADIAARLTAAMAEEGRALLDEGVALRSSDIDLVAVHGHGYPRWRGGPMFEAGRQVP